MRRAKFGQAPRVSPSLANTIQAIAREMEAERDSNIMDAWKNGGVFEGHKVTDQRVLAYWKEREGALDKKDPEYDTIKDQIMQLHYGIEQSQMDLKYTQGKIGDKEYAQFYIKWANKVPKNSEFWRTLQKDAAQLMEHAKQKAAADAKNAKITAFNKFYAAHQDDITLGNALTDAIDRIAKENGLNPDANGARVLELLTQDYSANPDRYHALSDAIKASGGNFNGTFSESWVGTQISQAEQAYDQIATRAHKDGFSDQYKAATQGQAFMSDYGASMKVWPASQAYDKAYSAYAKVWNDPHASEDDKAAAAAIFAGQVGKIASMPGLPQNAVQMLKADQTRALGGDAGDTPSFGTLTGHGGITPEVAQAITSTRSKQAAAAQSPGSMVYASLKSDGTFDPSGKGGVGLIAASSLPAGVTFVAQPGGASGPKTVAVLPHDVSARDPLDPSAKPQVVGQAITYYVGGQEVTLYGYRDGDGQQRWMTRSPFSTGSKVETDGEGNITVTPPLVTSNDPMAQAKAIDSKYGTSIADQIGTPGSSGKSVAVGKDGKRYTVSYDGSGGFKITAATLDDKGKATGNETSVPLETNTTANLTQSVFAPSVSSGGDIPGSTTSPMQASVQEAGSLLGTGAMRALAQDPQFQHAFLVQTMASTGATNPLDQRVVNAWNRLTAAANGEAAGGAALRLGPGGRALEGASTRSDLAYPGSPESNPAKTQATITFGGQTLRIPGLPAYMNLSPHGLNGTMDSPLAQAIAGVGNFFGQVLQPGQTPGMPGASTASPTAGGNTPAGPTIQTVQGSGPTLTPVDQPAPKVAKIDTAAGNVVGVQQPGGKVAY